MPRLSAFIPWLLLAVGLAIVLYPAASSCWNARCQSEVIQGYDQTCHDARQEQLDKLWNQALDYNRRLCEERFDASLPQDLADEYDQQLTIDVTGVMGYIDIPSIDVHLPIYHGTTASALQAGAGHLAWSSLPTGGEGTHCVISAHTGMPTASMFTDLRYLEEGDLFTLTVLDHQLTYEVDNIEVVDPHEVTSLALEQGIDLCTLLTCTPYGVNTDRLLVRGHRVYEDEVSLYGEDPSFDWRFVLLSGGVGTALLLALVAWWLRHWRSHGQENPGRHAR